MRARRSLRPAGLAVLLLWPAAAAFAEIRGRELIVPNEASRELGQVHDELFGRVASFHKEFEVFLGGHPLFDSAPDSLRTWDDQQEYVAFLERSQNRLAAIESRPASALTAQERLDAAAMSVLVRDQLHYYRDHDSLGSISVQEAAGRTRHALGKDEYAWRLKNLFGVDQSPHDLYHEGLDLADGVRREMEAVAAKIAPGRPLADVMAELAADHPASDAQMLDLYRTEAERARIFLIEHGLFDVPPDFETRVGFTPTHLRLKQPVASFHPGQLFNPYSKGEVRVTPTLGAPERLAFQNRAVIASIAAHESLGHGVQYDAYRRSKDISPIRYFMLIGQNASMHLEGDALRLEELLRKNGFFTARQELAHLGYKLLRAFHLVGDVGIHTGKRTPQGMIDLLKEKAFLSETAAQNELRRYLGKPMQGITYIVGLRQIEALASAVRKIVGPKFKESDFRKAFLSYGPVQPFLIAPILLEETRR